MHILSWQVAGQTDRGVKRSDNQDNFFISEDRHVFAVADGMGGAKGGAMASSTAVESLRKSWDESLPDLNKPDQVRDWLLQAVIDANKAVREAAEASVDSKSMGTTIVIGVVDKLNVLHIAHVGDSRATLVRGDDSNGLTNDHSVVMEMHLRGQLTKEQCAASPFKHLITRCLGHDENTQADYRRLDLKHGDRIVLASDGLSEVVEEKEIGRLMEALCDPEEVCRMLVNTVLDRDAPDNVTIVTARFYCDKEAESNGATPACCTEEASACESDNGKEQVSSATNLESADLQSSNSQNC